MKKEILLTIFSMYLLIILFNTDVVVSDPAINRTNLTAEGGNVTEISVISDVQTTIWQGFYGTISGELVLDDAIENTFYDWTLLESSGEVLATRDVVSDWSTINCTNQTQIYIEEVALAISNSSADSINRTYTNTTHPNFIIGTRTMSGCRSTLTDSETESQSVFWNVLLNADSDTVVYTAIIDDSTIGFNGTEYDFQLLVPANKTTGQANYQIYIELDSQ